MLVVPEEAVTGLLDEEDAFAAVAATFAAMARAVPRMKGMDYKALGAGGRLLEQPELPGVNAETSVGGVAK